MPSVRVPQVPPCGWVFLCQPQEAVAALSLLSWSSLRPGSHPWEQEDGARGMGFGAGEETV